MLGAALETEQLQDPTRKNRIMARILRYTVGTQELNGNGELNDNGIKLI